MGLAEDEIERFGVAFYDVAHRFDRELEALAAVISPNVEITVRCPMPNEASAVAVS